MPVTIAHPAAVLPLRGLGLPLSAMVLGSMAPDLPVFSQSWGLYGYTHSLAGILTVDLALTLVLLFGWDRWGRDAIVDTAPSRVRDRLPGRARIGAKAWLLAPLAAVLGSVTHVVWDAFTHRGRWGVRTIEWLHTLHGPLRGEQWAQHISGVVGMAVVGLTLLAVVRRPVQADAPRRRRLPVLMLPAAVGLASVLSVGTFLAGLDRPFESAAFDAAVVGIVSLGLALAGVTLAWLLAPAPEDEVSDRVAP